MRKLFVSDCVKNKFYKKSLRNSYLRFQIKNFKIIVELQVRNPSENSQCNYSDSRARVHHLRQMRKDIDVSFCLSIL